MIYLIACATCIRNVLLCVVGHTLLQPCRNQRRCIFPQRSPPSLRQLRLDFWNWSTVIECASQLNAVRTQVKHRAPYTVLPKLLAGDRRAPQLLRHPQPLQHTVWSLSGDLELGEAGGLRGEGEDCYQRIRMLRLLLFIISVLFGCSYACLRLCPKV